MDLIRTLTLRQLQIFICAASHVSFARAAEELHLTQPAVSMQIRQLEDTIGLALFERVGRGLALTEAGERFTRHAMRILGELRDAEETLQSLSGAHAGSITVGLVSTAKYFAPKLLARYSEQFPAVDVRLVIGNRERLLKLLQDNGIDLAIMGRIPKGIDAVSEPLAPHPHVIIAPAHHALREAKRFDLHELRGEAFLLREAGSGTRAVAEEMFKHHLFQPAKVVTLGSNETIKQAVMAGMGVSLLSLHTLLLELRTGEIALLDVNGTPIARTWHIVHMASKRLSPACKMFRQFLLDNSALQLQADYDRFATTPATLAESRATPS
ncbi:MAG TPA: LysR substrate-binding domain-containing protein [Paucimonas sp.]|nr:LysR substrate-binding domain-containing protein [Paucimonas sp.]HJW54956.1 LysR substrate-binding domain-containing protein [Burkholderiaceae bacterium]